MWKLSVFVAMLVLTTVHSLHFHVVCKGKETHIATKVIGVQNVEIFDPGTGDYLPSNPEIGINITLCDPRNKVTHTCQSSDQTICLHTNATTKATGLRTKITLDIVFEDYDIEYAYQEQLKIVAQRDQFIHQLIEKILHKRSWRGNGTSKEKVADIVRSTHTAVWWLLLCLVPTVVIWILYKKKRVGLERTPPRVPKRRPIKNSNPPRRYFTKSGREVRPPVRLITEKE